MEHCKSDDHVLQYVQFPPLFFVFCALFVPPFYWFIGISWGQHPLYWHIDNWCIDILTCSPFTVFRVASAFNGDLSKWDVAAVDNYRQKHDKNTSTSTSTSLSSFVFASLFVSSCFFFLSHNTCFSSFGFCLFSVLLEWIQANLVWWQMGKLQIFKQRSVWVLHSR